MREILFRGKRTDDKKWVFGDLEHNGNHVPKFVDGYTVDPETVGQFTGLTDKNGKKIFEGDICKDSLGIIFAVEWDNANGRFLGFTIGDRSISYVGKEPSVEVIGNIHDNPELLEVTDNA